MLKQFKEFVARGNVAELAVGVIIGAAFGKIVSSFVANLFINLSGQHYATVDAAKTAGAPTLNCGAFLQAIVDFLIVAFATSEVKPA